MLIHEIPSHDASKALIGKSVLHYSKTKDILQIPRIYYKHSFLC